MEGLLTQRQTVALEMAHRLDQRLDSDNLQSLAGRALKHISETLSEKGVPDSQIVEIFTDARLRTLSDTFDQLRFEEVTQDGQ